MRRWAEYAAEDEAEEEAWRAFHMDLVEVHAELAQRGADEAEEEAGRAFHTDLVKVHAELAQRCAGGGLLPLSSGSSVLGGNAGIPGLDGWEGWETGLAEPAQVWDLRLARAQIHGFEAFLMVP